MEPSVELDTTDLEVDPGGHGQAQVTVRNRHTIVERYRLSVVGDAAAWAQVVPDELRVDVDQEAVATILFNPPRGTEGPAGVVPFGVRAASAVDETSSAVAEGDVRVGEVIDVGVTMLPTASTGRWSARHRVEVANRSNVPLRVAVSATDADQRLGFLVTPEVLEIGPGESAHARLKVRTRDPALRGNPERLAFRVVADRVDADGEVIPPPPSATPPVPGLPYDPSRPGADGAFQQQPILSRGTMVVGTLAAAGLAGLATFAFTQRDEDAADGDAVAPEPPGDVQVAATGPGAVRVRWEEVPGVDGYKVLSIVPEEAEAERPAVQGAQAVEAGQQVLNVEDLPGGTHCYQVQSVRADIESPTGAPPQCAEVEAAPEEGDEEAPPAGGEDEAGSDDEQPGGDAEAGEDGDGTDPDGPGGEGTGDGGGPPEELGWVVLVQFVAGRDASTDAAAQADRIAETLPEEQRERVGVLDTTSYEGVPAAEPGSWVYVGGFEDGTSARAACLEIRQLCSSQFVTEPQPRDEG